MTTTQELVRLTLSLVLNVVSSVGVIFINKRLVFQSAGFHFGTALTVTHFIVTFIGCLAFAKFGFFELKKLELKRVISISLAFCGYVVFNNLSLLTNSVGFYQITKILCTPLIVLIEWLTEGKRQSTATLVSLVPVCLGIAVAVYADSKITYIGCFWAALAVISNSFYTIWGKTRQQALNVTPMQILSYQAPLSAAMLVLAAPAMDDMPAFMAFQYTPYAITCIALSCLFAFGVNFSFFLFVGQTSPLTMNVVGYLKTVLVFAGGFIFFEDSLTPQTAIGISLTLLGVALYSKAKLAPAVKSNEACAV